MANYTVLGVKSGKFTNDKGQLVPFHHLALDCGSYLKIFKVKDHQARYLEQLVPGYELTDADGFIAGKYFVFV